MKNDHKIAIDILKNELFRLGGKLFSKAAIEHFTKITLSIHFSVTLIIL